MKKCCICKTFKSVNEFYKDRRSKDGYRYECIPCRKIKEKSYYYADKSKSRKRIRKYLYGVSNEEFIGMYNNQNKKCKICSMDLELEYGRLKNTCHIDHDHNTGKVRSLLCLQCNSLLGMARDNKEILLRAAIYLKGFEYE